jgi:hypothetical protein
LRCRGPLCLLFALLGCESKPNLPAPAPIPLSYSTIRIAIPGCPVEIPRVRDDLSVCPPGEIGKSIQPEDVCELLRALQEWMAENPLTPPDMEPGDWTRVRAITVCRMSEPILQGEDPTRTPRRWRLTIEADVPERPRPFFVSRSEGGNAFQFGATHRGPL